MNLVVFDIDGTLTQTNQVDAQCFERAFQEATGLSATDEDWSTCRNITDHGITDHLFRQQRGHPPTSDEVQLLHDRFLAVLRTAALEQPQAFLPVPGALRVVQTLRADPQWALAIASGCWHASGRLKLQQAGLPLDDVPAAFAEDGERRVDVVATAIARAAAQHADIAFERVVSVGDGLWDIHVARRLRLPFVGIHGYGRSAGLKENGASHLFGDFNDLDQFLLALDEATIPE